MSSLSRRDFIRYAIVGIPAFAVGVAVSRYTPLLSLPRPGGRYRLAITEAMVQMVDRKYIFHWAFEDLAQLKPMPQMPGPLIDAVAGEELEISVTNNLTGVHGFRIPGVKGEVGSGVEIAPGETRKMVFNAPEGGSYLYYDHMFAPVNRVLGLHGPMVVLPTKGNTPYTYPTPNVQKLFDELGYGELHPGEPWKPERSKIWLFSSIDPEFNEMAEKGERIEPEEFKEKFLPRYFTINGFSGAYASHDPSIVPAGRIGQPQLIRIMNAGMAAHSPHIHGNHVYVLSQVDTNQVGRVRENVFLLDTETVVPLERMDWLLPFHRPPDIPGDESIPLRNLIKEELALTLGGVSQSPLSYPMHCHVEMSQTAAGGNYPQGLVTHWEITGDIDGVNFPHSNPEEKGGVNQELMEGGGR